MERGEGGGARDGDRGKGMWIGGLEEENVWAGTDCKIEKKFS